jgi:hypothetical protein
MAVRQGYGKIAGTDALVFAYDTGDTRNSYRGEPTTNLVTNANFSNGATGWSYAGNGASYFEITTFQGRTVLHGNGVQYYNQTGYIRQAISVTSGATYTFSMRYYVVAGGLTLDPDDGWNGGGTFTSTGQWLTYTSTFTTTSTSIMLNLYGQNSVASYYYITDIQIEQKSHATPFVNGTRSSTQGLLDLTGNSTVDLTSVSFDSDAQMTFDGTDDIIQISAASWNILQTFTLEAVFKPTGTAGSGYHVMFQKEGGYSGGAVYGLRAENQGSGDIFAMICYDNQAANVKTLTSGVPTVNGQTYHVVSTFDSLYSWKIYVNGEFKSSSTLTALPYQNSSAIFIGRGDSRTMNGYLPVAKIYSRVLTADEIRNNYNHYKTRYKI